MSVQMSRDESTTRWYYNINGQEFGPFHSAMMAGWMRDGWLPNDLQLRTENEQHYYTLGHYKATSGGYPFNLEPSTTARVGLGRYELSFNQQLASAHEEPHSTSYVPPRLARPINFVVRQRTLAGYRPFPPAPVTVPQQLRGAATPVFQTAAPSPPVHVVAKVRTEPIKIAATRAEAVLSELLQAPVKIIFAMPPPSSSISAGDEKRRGGAD